MAKTTIEERRRILHKRYKDHTSEELARMAENSLTRTRRSALPIPCAARLSVVRCQTKARHRNEVYSMTVSLPKTPERVLHALEPMFLPIASEPYDRKLSLDIIDHLMPLLNREPDIVEILRDYRATISVNWEHIVEEYGPVPDEYLLASQPEGLLLGYLLKRDRVELMHHWQRRFPLSLLDRFAVLWGYPLPDLD